MAALTGGTLGVIGASEFTKYASYELGGTWITGPADGVGSRSLTLSIAKNALVRKYTVRIGATRADGTTLDNSGQVRLQAQSGDSNVVVVDFGMLRTVSGIGHVAPQPAGLPGMTITSLHAFKGDAFDPNSLFAEGLFVIAVESSEPSSFEVRTERVRIGVQTTATLAQISANLWLQFPDLPSDIDIRVDNGAPAFTAPGPAQPNARDWDGNTQRVADLTKALAALSGDPHDASAFDATIALASRIPGILTLAEEASDIAFLGRIVFDGSEEKTLAFTEEGEYDVVLQLPNWVKRVQELRATLTGTAPPERVLQPVGPPIAMLSGGSGSAFDLLLDVDHSGAARLDPAKPFAELIGIRLPLRAGADGAEVRAVLYSGTDDGPTKPVDGGTTKPVDVPPAPAEAGDVWTTFDFAKPVKLDPRLTYWIVVVVGRGGASWSLGRFVPPQPAVPIRRGSAIGPWHELPNVVMDGATIGARIRAIGKPPPGAPVAALSVSVVGHSDMQVDASPLPKGASVIWVAPGATTGDAKHPVRPSVLPDVGGAPSAPTITLRITSRMTGTVKLSAVDVVAIKGP
jgi:hypothetical protein